MYQDNLPLPQKGVAKVLASLKKAQTQKKWSRCHSLAEKAKSKVSGIRGWVEKTQLDCLNEWGRVARKARQHLRKLVFAIDKAGTLNDSWNRKILLSSYIQSQFLLLKNELKAGSRVAAWKRVETLQGWEEFLDKPQKALLYFRAGELAFVEQKLMGAYNFFQRSLKFQRRPEIYDKLAIIRKTLPQLSDQNEEELPSAVVIDESLRYSENETKLVSQMKRSLESKDLVSVVEDGIKIVKDYPGSENASWAEDQILSVYLGVVGKSDKRFELVRQKILRLMKQADTKRLRRWARNAWARGAYQDAVLISEMALEKLSPHPEERKILILAAKSAVSAGKYALAQEYFERVSKMHGGTLQAQEALFRLGLLFYRNKDYSQSAFYFEKLLATTEDSDFQSQALYWRWRSYQKLGRKEVLQAAQELMKRYPLTYYGLRARAELNGGNLIWKNKVDPNFLPQSDLKVSLTFTQFENQVWQRYLLLLRSGWIDEAKQELNNLPAPVTPEQRVVLAKWSSKAMDHFRSITQLNKAWNEKPELRTLETVQLAYPFEFEDLIQQKSKKFKVSPHLVRGLMRQESSFRPQAVSPSNAYGLMQIVPITAKDIAQFLRWKKPLKLPDDMFDVSQNIHFGASYLGRMIRAFNGHVPLALAAYNAGIGRMRRWVKQRPDLGVDEKKLDSSPDSEIWIDELPWKETRHYVKAVMRNYLIYRMISENQVALENPVWK